MTGLSRRNVLTLVGSGAAAGLVPWRSFAQQAAAPSLPAQSSGGVAAASGRRHGLSIFGDLRYGPDFTHFDYVEPAAPKGGRMVMQPPSWGWNQNTQTFNTLNSFVLQGDAPPRMELTFDTLMVSAADEPDSLYGLLAEAVELSADGNELRFFLRQEPKFSDGSRVTAADVAWSLTTLKEKGHPVTALPMRQMASAEAAGEREVLVRFTGHQSRELKLLIAQLPIFSEAWWAGRDFGASTMEPILGSGPYKVGAMSPGSFIEYARVPDYWAADLPVRRGQNNFDVLRIEFYREREAEFQAFAKGLVTFREEFTAKTWATGYTFPAVTSGQVRKKSFPGEKGPDYQAWYINTRRAKFADPRTRQALGMVFDFEWTNANLFFNSYSRTTSYFESSDYAATGVPSAEELALLEPFREKLPAVVFGEPPIPPVSDGSGRDRNLLRAASTLLAEAGWKRSGSGLVNAKGEALSVEFVIDSVVFQPVLGKYVDSLRAIGVAANVVLLDAAQYQRRQNAFDFDVIAARFTIGATPLEGLRNFLSSDAADAPGSQNYAGIKDAVVDAMIAKAMAATDRASHRAALSALDRVLRAGFYTVPQWHRDQHLVAYWDLFGAPSTKPDYGFPFETTWWFDPDKAARIGKSG
ncbi:microcin C transport system substrate-binding protein [Faunimonas pinastri]|uniref:Microcin C transport system substrate-binding protein n=1 Tax=Faunimonas pinastri TaxID=1855383 RepID=A0A1H9HE65_9HYPH|nr:extracellular solute-binding protein [Faunimonas pinastri]SEQ60629.1 microcin C transport system substrate-binding protein [Faunimonas pinastri]